MRVIQSLPSTGNTRSQLRAIRAIPVRIALHLSEGTILLRRDDILYCTAESNYTHIHATQGRHFLLSKTLRQIEVKLQGAQFMRVHQSHLVNLDAIECISTHDVRMRDRKVLPLARGKRKMLLETLERLVLSI